MVWKITTDELLARYNAGERNFAGVEILRIVGEMGERDGVDGQITGLEGADLRGINLRGANLEKLDLSGADLTGADLFGAYLGEAGLVKTILRDANLFSANLSSATLNGADLTGSDLSQVNASSAVFIGATIGYFEYAVLIDANFQGAIGMLINGHFNLIWDTTMPDGTVEKGPYCKWK
ncbi:pentapeptide repeat-containing protein [Nodularia chucula]|uniref:pentapeptide repeat-containing protein n=1 Tax=Nodularia chucula TaxID=3093667 RepID=UPI0039C6E2F7